MFEYRVETYPVRRAAEEMNRMAANGWRVAAEEITGTRNNRNGDRLLHMGQEFLPRLFIGSEKRKSNFMPFTGVGTFGVKVHRLVRKKSLVF